MPPVLTIARLTIFEAIRRRVVLTVLILTPIVIGSSMGRTYTSQSLVSITARS